MRRKERKQAAGEQRKEESIALMKCNKKELVSDFCKIDDCPDLQEFIKHCYLVDVSIMDDFSMIELQVYFETTKDGLSLIEAEFFYDRLSLSINGWVTPRKAMLIGHINSEESFQEIYEFWLKNKI